MKRASTKKRTSLKPVVRRPFFAVVPPWGDERTMHVIMLGSTKHMAKRLYEVWNDNLKLTKKHMRVEGLVVKRFEAKNVA
jgi:hypothetical protein